jgi:hypothetical protein
MSEAVSRGVTLAEAQAMLAEARKNGDGKVGYGVRCVPEKRPKRSKPCWGGGKPRKGKRRGLK